MDSKLEWILLSERLPVSGQTVLVHTQSLHHVIAKYDEIPTADGYEDMFFTYYYGIQEIEDVLAWMPLADCEAGRYVNGSKKSNR